MSEGCEVQDEQSMTPFPSETDLYFPNFHTDQVDFIPVAHPKTALLC